MADTFETDAIFDKQGQLLRAVTQAEKSEDLDQAIQDLVAYNEAEWDDTIVAAVESEAFSKIIDLLIEEQRQASDFASLHNVHMLLGDFVSKRIKIAPQEESAELLLRVTQATIQEASDTQRTNIERCFLMTSLARDAETQGFSIVKPVIQCLAGQVVEPTSSEVIQRHAADQLAPVLKSLGDNKEQILGSFDVFPVLHKMRKALLALSHANKQMLLHPQRAFDEGVDPSFEMVGVPCLGKAVRLYLN